MALTKPSGKMVTPIVMGTMQASTSGTSIDFTSIPAGVKKITVLFDGVSSDSTGHCQIQIGDSGGLEASGYVSMTSAVINAGASASIVSTTSFQLIGGAASRKLYGVITLALVDAASFRWAASGNVYLWADGTVTNDYMMALAGSKSLSAELDRISLVLSAGNYDAGSINIQYEF